MKRISLALTLSFCALSTLAFGQGTPKIQFEKLVYDFGKVTESNIANGKFICKNTGDGVLTLQQPQAQCGCTVPRLEKDTLKPGESCDLAFTISLARGAIQKTITVPSNDPNTPQVVLTIKAEYTPLYDVLPQSLYANIPFGGIVPSRLTVTRTDGKPLKLHRLEGTQPWLTAKVDREATTNESSAVVVVEVKAPEKAPLPPTYNEVLHIYAGDQTNSPIASVQINGRFLPELNITPPTVYWQINDTTQIQPVRQVATARLAGDKEFQARNAQSSLKDVSIELMPLEGGKAYGVMARLTKIPAATVTGTISFETSVASQPKVEIPVTIVVPARPTPVAAAPPASITRPQEPVPPSPLPR